MRFSAYLILFLGFALPVFSQPGGSELKEKLQRTTDNHDRYTIYHDLFKLYQYSKNDSAIYFIQKGVDEFSAKKYDVGRASCLTLLGDLYAAKGMFQIAKTKQEEALQVFTELKNQDGIGTVEDGLGVIEGRSSHFDAAIHHFLIALKAFETVNNKEGIISTYLKLGKANEGMGSLDKGIDYYKRAIALAGGMPVSANIVILYNNIGVAYCRKGDFKTGGNYFQKSLELTADPIYADLRIQPLTNMGNLFKETGELAKAIDYYTQALEIAKREGLPEEQTRAQLNIALITARQDPEKALNVLYDARTVTRRINHKELESEVLDGMISIYEHKGNYKDAFLLFEQNQDIKDSLYNIDRARAVANIQALYDLDKSTDRIKELKITAEVNAHKRDIILAIAISVSICLLIVALYLWRTRILNSKLLKREQELKHANYVKDRLFSVVGHDLKGPIGNIPPLLSFLRIKETSEQERDIILNALEETVNSSVETLENLLTWGKSQIKGISLNQIDLLPAEVLLSEINLLKIAALNKNILVHNNVPSATRVYADRDHVKIIFRNLLSNAIKFTQPGGKVEVNVVPSTAAGFITFVVKDSGVGMDAEQQKRIFDSVSESKPGTANEAGNSIGLMLCKSFVEENGGTIWVDSHPDKGSSFYFTLKAGTRA